VSDQNPAPESADTTAEPVEAPPARTEGASTSSATETSVAPTEFVELPTLVEPSAEPDSTSSATAAAAEPIIEEPATASEAEPIVATPDPAAVETEVPTQPEHRVVYVEAPRPPRKKGNRGVGIVIAIVAAIVYAVLYAIAALVIFPVWAPGAPVSTGFSNFLGSTVFWVPVLFFLVFFVLLVLLVNRAGWWAYVIGGNVVAAIVYFGSVGVFLLQANVVLMTPAAASHKFGQYASEPFVIAAGLIALETTIWAGAIVAARGRRVKAKNAQAREAWESESPDYNTDSGMIAP
jgi:hypothetical protein